jgi:tripartite-type tricarboxylate transporter receptor subunit TctC
MKIAPIVLRPLMAILACVAGIASVAHAQAYPTRPVRLVVGFPPGGSGDFIARNMSEELQRLLGQQIIVDNRPGAGSNIATEIVARAQPDGHTVLLGGSFSHCVNPVLYRKVAFDPVKDFSPITQVANFTTIIAANPRLGVNTLKELIARARAEPGRIGYATPGAGTPSHMAGVMLNIAADIKLEHVPFKGGAPSLIATLAGDVPLIIGTPPVALPQIRAGRLKALSLTTARASPVIPGVPGAAEAGVANYDVGGWWGLWAPAGTSAATVRRLHETALAVLKKVDIAERLAREGLEIATSRSPAEFDAFVKAQIPYWAKVVRDSGATVD